MAKNGADVVICQHSHCLGCYEKYNDCHILYGQGNFHFVKPVDPKITETWNSCLACEYDSKENTVAFTPICTCENGIKLAKGAEKEAILSSFAQRNEELKSGEWINGWRQFCESMAERYIKNAQSAAGLDR